MFGGWALPDRAKVSDNSRTYHSNLGKEAYGYWLRCTNFGFSTDDLPTDATIDGIEVQIEKSVSALDANTITDSAIYLRKTAGQTGDNKASAAYWPTTEAYATHGGAADDWNATLIDTDIRHSDFGIDISPYNTDSGGTHSPNVDHVQIRIHYTEASTSPPGGMMRMGVGDI